VGAATVAMGAEHAAKSATAAARRVTDPL
jgi:hypothetical protein